MPRATLLPIALALVLAGCVSPSVDDAQVRQGYGGRRVADAVRVVVRPVDGPSPIQPGARPDIYTQQMIENISAWPIRVHRCAATAVGLLGRALFRLPLFWGDLYLRPGERQGDRLDRGDYGGGYAPAGVDLAMVQAVVRYRVSCDVFLWNGPPPIFEGS